MGALLSKERSNTKIESLVSAIYSGKQQEFENLLMEVTNIELNMLYNGKTAMHHCVIMGDNYALERIIKSGKADLYAIDSKGRNILEYAITSATFKNSLTIILQGGFNIDKVRTCDNSEFNNLRDVIKSIASDIIDKKPGIPSFNERSKTYLDCVKTSFIYAKFNDHNQNETSIISELKKTDRKIMQEFLYASHLCNMESRSENFNIVSKNGYSQKLKKKRLGSYLLNAKSELSK